MHLVFWGVRGSIPSPDRNAWRYGGNTPCLEIRSGKHLFILDAGTGIRELGNRLIAQAGGKPVQASLLLTHYHWDQIQGLPFFEPLYKKGNTINIIGPTPRAENPKTLEGVIEALFRAPFFPISADQIRSQYTLREVPWKGEFKIGDTLVRTCEVNHPQGSLAFRLEDSESTVVYATDHEPGKPEFDDAVLELAKGADLLVSDAQYCPEELESAKAGWGHGSWQSSVKMAMKAGAKSLFLFHHEPWRSDQELDDILNQARQVFRSTYAAAEGMVVDVDQKKIEVSCRGARLGQRTPLDLQVRVERPQNRSRSCEARLQDISFYGAFFRSQQPFEPEESIDLILPLMTSASATKPNEFRLRGYVLRAELQPSDGWYGVAIHFPSASPDLGVGGTTDSSG